MRFSIPSITLTLALSQMTVLAAPSGSDSSEPPTTNGTTLALEKRYDNARITWGDLSGMGACGNYISNSDWCPTCPTNGIDLTPSLFSYFASTAVGTMYGTWNFV
ncbi:hypothetical protein CVT24_008864 [Panaeolus cyanescens]|uniref:Uncharacterized protein n=1 Tax=Panaeolus cyanescens TaxID=181874 RepID=A0A409VAV7_9AGAR|nr:hypothetical protein CVT24_008864 [Panaeolus cyanescens]